MNQSTDPRPQCSTDIELQTKDGHRLAATVYTPAKPALGKCGRPAWILLGSATAVPRGFYRRFAQFACQQGLHVIVSDYRGIGGSRRGGLRGFEMNYADWSTQDLAAAHAHAAERGPVWLVGHSLAGHAIGQLPRANDLQAALVCATGAGWHGYMPKGERRKVWLMWNLLGPVLTRALGYYPMSWFGLGEDLPMGVYRDWKRWCATPHYFFDDPQAHEIVEGIEQVRLDIGAINATDDWWALPASRDAFFKGFTQARIDRMDLRPESVGVAQVGHMGYFRESVGRQLWPRMLNWLRERGLPAAT